MSIYKYLTNINPEILNYKNFWRDKIIWYQIIKYSDFINKKAYYLQI